MTHDERSDAIDRVTEFARQIGLHGVMILSPRCPVCGSCHDFAMVAEAVRPGDPDQSVRDLLLGFADIATSVEPVLVPLGNPKVRQ